MTALRYIVRYIVTYFVMLAVSIAIFAVLNIENIFDYIFGIIAYFVGWIFGAEPPDDLRFGHVFVLPAITAFIYVAFRYGQEFYPEEKIESDSER
jgi:hypothetical protein